MPDPLVLALYALLALLRLWRVRPLLGLAVHRGADWVFDAKLGAAHPQRPRLLRRYRAWIVAPTVLIELAALADLLAFGDLRHIACVHVPLTWLLAIERKLAVRACILAARDLVLPPADGRLVLSLRPRRLADATSATFELVNGAAMLAAIAALALAPDRALWPAAFVGYYALGSILWKLSLLRRPVPLPAQRTEEYLALVDDAVRAAARQIDAVRACCTAVLAVFAALALWDRRLPFDPDRFVWSLLGVVAVATVAALVAGTRRGRALLERARAFDGPIVRPRLPDPENLRCCGLLYVNADNPAVVVDGGPLRFAVNVVNATTYLYVAWWLGLGLLLGMLVEQT